jgi:hypothetical protein
MIRVANDVGVIDLEQVGVLATKNDWARAYLLLLVALVWGLPLTFCMSSTRPASKVLVAVNPLLADSAAPVQAKIVFISACAA